MRRGPTTEPTKDAEEASRYKDKSGQMGKNTDDDDDDDEDDDDEKGQFT